jgi:hypothetical protein
MSESPEGQLWTLIRGGLTARVAGIVAELGVADALADGPRAVDELAQELGASADFLYRALRALASDGVFAEEEPRVFRNTAASELLRGDGGWRDFAYLFGSVWLRTSAELDATGTPTFPRLFGTDFWSWLAEHPRERAAFDTAMGQGKEQRLERLAPVEWRDGDVVVDVGGGNGSFLRALLERRPGLRGIVFDLPETVRDESTFDERMQFVEGSFFERVPRGDVYVLGTILHDWNDERATDILRTIRASAPDDARLILVETVVQPGNEPGGSKWLDLLMLALLDGRERDEAQWRALLAAGAWEPVQIRPDVIEARAGATPP